MSGYSYSRKLNKGRPTKFRGTNCYIECKKQELFENTASNKEPMNLINLSYQLGKLTKEEFDIACFIEYLHNRVVRCLGEKTLPSSSPNTWTFGLQKHFYPIDRSKEDNVAQTTWKKVKCYVETNKPTIANEFFNIIGQHHSYEDLQMIKNNTFNITNILKEGLNCISKMIDLGDL